MAFSLAEGHISHNLSQELSDLVNLGERLTALLQVVIAGVDVGPHRERGVIVACPLADNGDWHAGLLHQAQSRVPRVVQPDLGQASTSQQAGELVGVRLGMKRIPSWSVTTYSSPAMYQSRSSRPAR